MMLVMSITMFDPFVRFQFSDPIYDTHYANNYQVHSVIPHEKYNPETFANDIGLVRTIKRMAWNRGVAPACLPSPSDT